MRVKTSFPILFILLSLLLFAGMAMLNQFSYSSMIDHSEKEQFSLMQAIVHFNLKGTLGKALARSEMLADSPVIFKALKERNRAELLRQNALMFEHQQDKYGMLQLQYTIPPHTMFLRVQNPSKFGDDVSFRRSVLDAYALKKVISGIEISRTGPGLLAVAPLMEGKQVFGTVGVGMDFAPMLDNLKNAYGFELSFLVKQKPLVETATLMDKSLINPENILGNTVNYHSTDWKRMRQLVNPDNIENLKEDFAYTKELDKQVFGVVVIPIQDYSQRVIGYITAFKDFQATRSNNRNFLILQVVTALCSLLLLAGLVLVVLKGGLTRPLAELSERLSQLAQGELPPPVDPADFAADLQPLAEAYQQLQQAAQERVIQEKSAGDV